jgi:MoxR-like ATPase
MTPADWHLWRNDDGDAARFAASLGNAPPWRQRDPPAAPVDRPAPALSKHDVERAERWTDVCPEVTRDAVNVALLLRRPLLVRGRPGLGKSTLASHLALRLGLGAPLRWEIGSRTTLADGLYSYDAVSHLRAMRQEENDRQANPPVIRQQPSDLGSFITLGPVGTALLPTAKPRVLLIDELDKASYDLPNDLLHVLEEGSFRIPELARHHDEAEVYPVDPTRPEDKVRVANGQVSVWRWPVVIITTNDEREFTEAFRRRCVTLELKLPDDKIARQDVIVRALTARFPDHSDAAFALAERFNAPVDRMLAAMSMRIAGATDAAIQGTLGLEG